MAGAGAIDYDPDALSGLTRPHRARRVGDRLGLTIRLNYANRPGLEGGLNFLSAGRDRIFLIAGQADGDYPVTINGQQRPAPATLRVRVEYRLRFIHITRGGTVDIALTQNGSPVRWRAVAKDGAELPEALRLGETFDFLWTPTESGEAIRSVRYARFVEVDEVVLQQKLYMR